MVVTVARIKVGCMVGHAVELESEVITFTEILFCYLAHITFHVSCQPFKFVDSYFETFISDIKYEIL